MAVRPLSSTLKTLALCDVVAASTRPMRLADVVRATGDARGATYQRLRTLVEAGFLEQTADTAFRLSLRFQLYANAAFEQANLGARAADILHDVMTESGETASLSVLEGTHAVIVRRVESRQLLRADLRVGARLSLTDTASGLTLMAYADPVLRERLARDGASLPSGEALAAVRSRGFAIHKPADPDTVSAVAAPVLDASGFAAAALAVSGPTTRFDHETCGALAVRAARRISNMMSGGDQ